MAAIRDLDRVGDVKITVPDERFAPQIEAAAYFLCLEALTNAAKYAQATIVTVSIMTTGGMLLVEIADDGIGGADPANGTGLLGLRDRLDALGGMLTVEAHRTGRSSTAQSRSTFQAARKGARRARPKWRRLLPKPRRRHAAPPDRHRHRATGGNRPPCAEFDPVRIGRHTRPATRWSADDSGS